MILEDETTWPREILRFVETHERLFDDWHGPTSEVRVVSQDAENTHSGHLFSAKQYDSAHQQLTDLLAPLTLESGYHCTRLLDSEIEGIVRSGMQLQNRHMLSARIESARRAGFFDEGAATQLMLTNQTDDKNRAGKLWFCFFPPHRAGQSGISDFFRYWGGEALYRSHCQHAERGPLLQTIGRPCVVVADIVVSTLNPHSGLVTKLVRHYFANRGFDIHEDRNHQGYAVRAIPSANIRRVVGFPDDEFLELTQCTNWHPPLGAQPC